MMSDARIAELLRLAGDHLWQSTLIALAAALLALACRRSGAGVRHGIWLAASLKFLIPVAALVTLGGQISWRTIEVVPYTAPAVLLEAVSEPFSRTAVSVRPETRAPEASSFAVLTPRLLLAIWLTGAVILLERWIVRWRRIRAVVRGATPLADGRELESLCRLAVAHGVRPLPIVSSDTSIEPGVFGIVRPVLLWPRGISQRLTDAEVDAILAHELCHLRRRDNLAAAVHMAVQAIFWFHPLVWWIGARLVDERERACDEAVVQAGNEPEVYAESILKTCKFFIESPLACVSGVTGSELRKRVEQIMTNDRRHALGVWRRVLLAAAGIVAFVTPVAVGALNPPPQTRALPAPASLPAFDEISIRANVSSGPGGRGGGQMQPGRFVAQNLTLRNIIRRAFSSPGAAPGSAIDLLEQQIAGGPAWLNEDKFDVVATTTGPAEPSQMRLMLQRLLADRFKLQAHWETRELPVYLLRMARADGRPGPGLTLTSEEECAKARGMGPMAPPPPGVPAPPPPCGAIQFGPGQLVARGAPMEWLAQTLTNVPVVTGIDRPVFDRTELQGNYGFVLKFSPATAASPDADRPHLVTALDEQLGLRLEATRAPVDVLVIDSAEKPDAN